MKKLFVFVSLILALALATPALARDTVYSGQPLGWWVTEYHSSTPFYIQHGWSGVPIPIKGESVTCANPNQVVEVLTQSQTVTFTP